MSPAHLANLGIHVAAGTVAMAIGFWLLARPADTAAHRRWGRIFGIWTLLVCASAALGLAVFRFMPLFAVLTVLVAYQLVGGWRAARTREQGPQAIDALCTLLAGAASAVMLPVLLGAPGGGDVVVRSALAALAALLLYDSLRWLFPRRWFARLWRYEHAYKQVSSLFAMLSALVGNVVRVGQPWSQLLPSLAGVLVIGWVFRRLHRQDAGRFA